ncbi:MAG: AAA family ATPase [Anaerolineales bacterium]|nr:AAA family ATPase [Anaerolineales bacterium]
METASHAFFPILSDQPSPQQDLLNFNRYAKPIAELIRTPETQTPLTIGIYGCWGSGKTTLMELIRSQLPSNDFLHVRFNPWVYRNEENLIVPLLYTIHQELKASPLPRFLEAAQRVAVITLRMAAAFTLKTVSAGAVAIKDIDGELKEYNKAQKITDGAIGELREELRRTIQGLTSDDHRMVIYVDDLDRCLPGQVVDLLEAIKLFLDSPNTVVLLAVDPEIVGQGFQAHYRDFKFNDEKQSLLTNDYLDKMIQLWISLNPLNIVQAHSYLTCLSERIQLRLTSEQTGWLAQAVLPNPRKIKRVLNGLALHKRMLAEPPVSDLKLDFELMMRFVLLQQQWPTIYARVRANPELIGALCDVIENRKSLSRDADWVALKTRTPEIVTWCQAALDYGPHFRACLKPSALFSGMNFQPYFEQLG